MTAKSHVLVAQKVFTGIPFAIVTHEIKSQLEKLGIKKNAVQLTLVHGLKIADAFPATYRSSFCRISCILACIC